MKTKLSFIIQEKKTPRQLWTDTIFHSGEYSLAHLNELLTSWRKGKGLEFRLIERITRIEENVIA